MKFYDVIMVMDEWTQIKVVVTMYGMKFSSVHTAEYFLKKEETDELLEKRVQDMRVTEDCLEVVLKEGE